MEWLEPEPVLYIKVMKWSNQLNLVPGLTWRFVSIAATEAMGQTTVTYFGHPNLPPQKISTNTHAYGGTTSGKSGLMKALEEFGALYGEYNTTYSDYYDAGHTVEQCYPVFINRSTLGSASKEIQKRDGMGIGLYPEQGLYCSLTVFVLHVSYYPCTIMFLFFFYFLLYLSVCLQRYQTK